jgi:putative iron-dependent peroxidase
MLENMFVGRPPGNYDRLLDFSRAVTGNLFFAPSATFLENLDAEESTTDSTTAASERDRTASSPVRDTSLGIGSLKGVGNE